MCKKMHTGVWVSYIMPREIHMLRFKLLVLVKNCTQNEHTGTAKNKERE